MTERRSAVRAAVHLLLATATVILLVTGVGSHESPPALPAITVTPVVAPAAETRAEAAPMPGPEDADHDGCPRPWENPCAAGWVKPPLPPSRHGGHPSQRPKAVTETAFRAGVPAAGASALRWTRPSGPRLPVFRC
ncbi:hypothetical protein ACWEN6_18835 [Sphaerisporangium sp. NPDC004334]